MAFPVLILSLLSLCVWSAHGECEAQDRLPGAEREGIPKTSDVPASTNRLVERQAADIRRQDHLRPGLIELRRHLWTKTAAQRASISVGADGLLLIADSTGIRALDARTGQAAWPLGLEDPGYLLNADSQFSTGRVPGNLEGLIHGNYWIGRVSGSALNARLIPDQLVCLDLKSQGKLAWNKTAENVMGSPGWEFATSPIRGKPDSFQVLLRKGVPQAACAFVQFDLSGSIKERVEIPGDQFKDICGEINLVNDGASLFVVTQNECLEFSETTEGLTFQKAHELFRSPSDSRGKLSVAVNRSVLLRLCGHELTIWERSTGVVARLDLPFLSENQGEIVQLTEQFALICGTGLIAVDLKSKQPAWTFQPVIAELQFAGRGIVLGERILCPTTAGISAIDLQSGELLQQIPLQATTGIPGGDLFPTEGILLIHSSRGISAFEHSAFERGP